MTEPVLSDRALNRATLERQSLLQRSALTPHAAITRLVGLQAQEPPDPYVALWSRLEGFDPEMVSAGLEDRTLVRMVVMRGTIHLITAEDALVLRPLVQSVLDGELTRHSEFKDALAVLDLDPIMATLRPLVSDTPRSGTELRALIAATFPDLDARALAYACRNRLDMVQVPPRGLWRRSSQVRTIPLEAWVGRPPTRAPSIDEIVLRYLAAFGPASAADVTAWSGLPAMREVIDRLADRLRPFRSEGGRELWDLPDAPRPDPDGPAPVRFLPEYDNVLLSHADRSRFQWRGQFSVEPPVKGTVLVDGVVRAVWHPVVDDGRVSLVVRAVGPLPKPAQDRVGAEGRRLLRFTHPGQDAEVRVVAPG
jgi:hypothetical protein